MQPGARCPSPRGQLRASGPHESGATPSSSGPPACREHRSPGARADARGEASGSASCVTLRPPGPLPCHHLPGNSEREPWLCPHPLGDDCSLLTLCHLRMQRSCVWGARLPECSLTDSCCLGPREMPAVLLEALSLSEGHRHLTGQDACVRAVSTRSPPSSHSQGLGPAAREGLPRGRSGCCCAQAPAHHGQSRM